MILCHLAPLPSKVFSKFLKAEEKPALKDSHSVPAVTPVFS